MNLALWIAAGLLAVVALAGGISKAFVPKERLARTPELSRARDIHRMGRFDPESFTA